jgi:hypothetical protein
LWRTLRGWIALSKDNEAEFTECEKRRSRKKKHKKTLKEKTDILKEKYNLVRKNP